MCSFVLSRLDYCNAPLAGLPATHIAHLQRIQNNAARLVLQKSKRQHVTPLLKQLYWLPIQTRIDYKLATLAFRHFDDSLPQYLSSRLDIYQPSRSLRSSNDRLLRVPLSGTGLSATKDLSFGTLFPLISNSHIFCPPLNPDWKHICSRSRIHYAEINSHICYWPSCNDKKDVDAVQSWLLILS